jgi:hypothetical protein
MSSPRQVVALQHDMGDPALFGRLGDNWFCLLAVARVADGLWAKTLALETARALLPTDDDAENLAVKLLSDMQKVWPVNDRCISTGTCSFAKVTSAGPCPALVS